MKTTIYKVTNANVRKNFLSLEELKKHIEDKKVYPNDESSKIQVQKITTENLDFDVIIPNFSIESAVIFLTRFKKLAKQHNYLEIEASNIGWFIEDVRENKKYKDCVLSDFIWNKVQNMGFTEEFLASYDNWYGEDGKYSKFKEIFLEYIQHIIDNIPSFFSDSRVGWKKILTDYKSCNAHGMKLKLGKFTLYFLIRGCDVLISTTTVYGRNVNSRGIMNLTDDDVK